MMTTCLLLVEVHALWVQRSELLYPVALPSSQAFIKTSHDFKGTAILRSSRKWPGLLKWPATDFSVRLCVMSFRCPLRQMCTGFCVTVSPTYCFWH